MIHDNVKHQTMTDNLPHKTFL